jgi:hypothetical protein
MNENWEKRRQEYRDKIAAEDAIISGETKKLEMSPEDKSKIESINSTLDKKKAAYNSRVARGQQEYPAAKKLALEIADLEKQAGSLTNRGGQIDLLKKQSEGITGPAAKRRTAAEKGLAGIDEEIKNSQLPLRERAPLVGMVAPPLAWTVAALTGGKVGKFVRGAQEARADKMNNLVSRAEQHIADTTLKTGKPGAAQFRTPEGRGLGQELQGWEGKGVAPYLAPLAAAGTAGTVGALEGALAPGGMTAIDAVRAPGGSPLQEAASNAPFTKSFWMQTLPEMGVAGGAAALASLASSLSRGKGAGYGPVVAPTERIGGLAAASRAANMPSLTRVRAPKIEAPKTKAVPKVKAKAKAPTEHLDDLPDL